MDTLFFIISKGAWAVIRPEGLIVIANVFGVLALWFGRSKLASGLFTPAALAMAGIAVFPLGDLVLSPLETRFRANPNFAPVTGIIVLGGAEIGTISTAWGQPATGAAGERFLAGIWLARQHPEAVVLFSGGNGRLGGGPSGADIAEDIFLSAGIGADRLVLERNSRNTAENARLLRRIITVRDGDRWLLVTSAYHMPRSVAVFCSAEWTGLIPYPVDFRSGAFSRRIGWDFAQNLDEFNLGVREWLGLLAYRLSGQISSADSFADCLASRG